MNTAFVLRELMQRLAAQGRMIFYSSHVLEIVEKICSRVLILNKGHVVADGAIEQLRDLAHSSSLEGIFAQLTAAPNRGDAVGRILEVMQA